MLVDIVQFVVGTLVVWFTLRDVFDTVVVPGESRASLRLASRMVFAGLFGLRHTRRPGAAIPAAFAPFVLVASFTGWMLLLIFGFGLMVAALSGWYRPAVPTFSQAVFVAGSSLVTVGLSETDATGPSRWVNIAAGFCGLSVMTMAVTYLLQVQTSIGRRDSGILKITTASGDPPSAVALLERYASLGCKDELEQVLVKGRDWCAEVLQSHASHPFLIYFRSLETGAGWPATLAALLDLAAVIEAIDEPRLRGKAILLREEGTHLADELSKLLRLDIDRPTTDREVLQQVLERAARAGYGTPKPHGLGRLASLRERYAPTVEALSRHLGSPPAPLLPNDRSLSRKELAQLP
ncbi:MAG: hypothetical protein E5X34_05320 [Mesorhizobium sp.]|uniref:hypothetical protein n=1 Tax=Mesorhizobium sp. TaxID=1871066 RepID=UPI00121A789B|nr:hypothetical protein [Mesorhizobium sp.]TIR26273.1 MAG: hypothetical protein E5X34_05320 [Mesorhizobium sp.]